MIVYVDTSVLVKRYIHETSSDEVIALIDQADAVGTAILTRVEMASALEKAVRLKWVKREIALQSWQDFLDHWPSFTRMNITPGTIERASNLAWEHGLRGYDAVHFASSLTWQETLDAPIMLATFDHDLWKAGEKAGMQVWPEDLLSENFYP